MKKGEKKKGVAVACITERTVAKIAATLFHERATATSDLTTGFVLPHAATSPKSNSLHCRRRRRPSAAARSLHPLRRPDPRFNAAPAPNLNAAPDAARPQARPRRRLPLSRRRLLIEVSTPAPPPPLPLPRVLQILVASN